MEGERNGKNQDYRMKAASQGDGIIRVKVRNMLTVHLDQWIHTNTRPNCHPPLLSEWRLVKFGEHLFVFTSSGEESPSNVKTQTLRTQCFSPHPHDLRVRSLDEYCECLLFTYCIHFYSSHFPPHNNSVKQKGQELISF